MMYRGISSGVEHLTPDQQVGRSIRSFLTLFVVFRYGNVLGKLNFKFNS